MERKDFYFKSGLPTDFTKLSKNDQVFIVSLLIAERLQYLVDNHDFGFLTDIELYAQMEETLDTFLTLCKISHSFKYVCTARENNFIYCVLENVFGEKGKILFENVAGLHSYKESVKESIIDPKSGRR